MCQFAKLKPTLIGSGGSIPSPSVGPINISLCRACSLLRTVIVTNNDIGVDHLEDRRMESSDTGNVMGLTRALRVRVSCLPLIFK
jgi:hypothetical protein